MGLEGESPEHIDPKCIPHRIETITKTQTLNLGAIHSTKFVPIHNLLWYGDKQLPFHPNGIKYTAMNDANEILRSEEYYSIGGGFVVNDNPNQRNAFRMIPNDQLDEPDAAPKHPFGSAAELLDIARAHDCNISGIMYKNEMQWKSEQEIKAKLLEIWSVMDLSIRNGVTTKGLLQTKGKRRAAAMYEKLSSKSSGTDNDNDPLNSISGEHYDDWLYCWAMAVNEENAVGGRVVTAPTNGAAGVIPAVIKYYTKYHKSANDDGICNMLLTASGIGMLYKKGASLSAAEVGCQGEIGVAASMAAAALCEVMGGNILQVANAAEIAMEHSLGLTCDPIGGFVEIPCIERNALGAKRAVNAARLALYGDGKHMVSLDAVIKTMKQIGDDMDGKYKETSLGGLALNAPVC